MTKQGQYLYAIVATREEKSFGPIGIGDGGNEVHTVCYQDIGAVISASPVVKYSVSRANTMAHQRVMEEAMKYSPILPVRFGTVGEGVELIKEKVLRARYDELRHLLTYVADKVELGLKALWASKEILFAEIVEQNKDIRLLRDRLKSRGGGIRRDQLQLGEMVRKALEIKNALEEKAILEFVKGLWIDHKANKTMGDQMITNSAFLVKKEMEKEFDQAVGKVSAQYDGRVKLKYVGPVPPCNFIEIVVKW